MSELCSTCKGSGSLFSVHNGKREWWRCPACGGAGARVQHGPATIRIHDRRDATPRRAGRRER